MMKIALYGRERSQFPEPCIQAVFDAAAETGASIYVLDTYYDTFPEWSKMLRSKDFLFSKEHFKEQAFDMLLSVGGDGTFLEAASLIDRSNAQTPIVGLSTGRLGFLTYIAPDDTKKSLKNIIAGRFKTDVRALLQIETVEGIAYPYALNEITIQKRDNALISVNAFVDGAFMATYWADGLIIATPTGSTAYSLSAGGPIVTPDSKNIIISPIAPHNLNVRPIVLPDHVELEFEVICRNNRFMVSVDSQYADVPSGETIRIRTSQRTVTFIQPEDTHFYRTLRNKLYWGVDKRG